jgi:hypothetical protein
MRPSLIIPRIRSECPIFAGRVAGSATAVKAMEEGASIPVPHAFVMPGDLVPTGEALLSGLDQELNANFSVLVALDNRDDPRGQSAAEAMYDAAVELFSALIGWTPDASRYAPCLFAGMPDIPDLNRAYLWAQLDFQSLAYTATAA